MATSPAAVKLEGTEVVNCCGLTEKIEAELETISNILPVNSPWLLAAILNRSPVEVVSEAGFHSKLPSSPEPVTAVPASAVEVEETNKAEPVVKALPVIFSMVPVKVELAVTFRSPAFEVEV